MGSLPRLKDKDIYRYRKGSTMEHLNCHDCEHLVRTYEIKDMHGTFLRFELRCRKLGLKESIRYRVREDHTCDRQETSKAYLAMVEKWKLGFRKEAS